MSYNLHNNLWLDSWLDSSLNYLSSNHQLYDSSLTWLGTQPSLTQLVVESWVGNPCLQSLVLTIQVQSSIKLRERFLEIFWFCYWKYNIKNNISKLFMLPMFVMKKFYSSNVMLYFLCNKKCLIIEGCNEGDTKSTPC